AVRDFNWDGKPDLIWRHQATGQLGIWFLDGTSAYTYQYPIIPQVSDTNWQIVGSGDFNRDNAPYLFWQNVATGDLAVWYMWGPTVIGTTNATPNRITDTNWRIASIGDVDRDG